MTDTLTASTRPIRETLLLFLRLGATSFGGPAVHIALMEEEAVVRRGWVSRERFLDLVGATNLIPGPNSTELAMHLGWQRAGMPGLLAAGFGFLLPAVSVTLVLAWFYVRYGTLPALQGPLAGVRAVVVAIIGAAVWRLGRTALKTRVLGALAAVVFGAGLLGVSPLLLLFGSAVLGALVGFYRSRRGSTAMLFGLAPIGGLQDPGLGPVAGPGLAGLGLIFLKVGAILYGSGYVLIAFLDGGLVQRLGWLTRTQLLDAVAVGQFTPGPVLSTATFVGYQVLGFSGAAVATAAIFLPSFVLVAITAPWVERIRSSLWAATLLDAVNVAAVALMAVVLIQLGRQLLIQPATAILGLLAIVLLLARPMHPIWLILGGAAAGAFIR